jgi:hypothetical protein
MYAMKLDILGDPEILYTLNRVYIADLGPAELFNKVRSINTIQCWATDHYLLL